MILFHSPCSSRLREISVLDGCYIRAAVVDFQGVNFAGSPSLCEVINNVGCCMVKNLGHNYLSSLKISLTLHNYSFILSDFLLLKILPIFFFPFHYLFPLLKDLPDISFLFLNYLLLFLSTFHYWFSLWKRFLCFGSFLLKSLLLVNSFGIVMRD